METNNTTPNHMETPQMPPERPQCTAKSKQSGERCKNRPAKGFKTCRFHGSANGRSKAAAKRRVDAVAAEEAVRTLGLPVDISPTEALLDEVRWTAGHVQWLRRQVQELESKALTWGKTKEVDKGSGEAPGVDVTESATPSIWYDLYERERQHLVRVCSAALKAGVEERRVRIAESHGAEFAHALRSIFGELDLTVSQQALVAEVVPRQLRLLMSGSA